MTEQKAPKAKTAPLEPEGSVPSKPVGRRVFIGLAGAGVAGIAIGSHLQNAVNTVTDKLSSIDPSGIVGGIVPHDQWTIYTITDGYPKETEAQYTLRVSGLVDRPMTLRYEDLVRKTPTHITSDFQCVTGWRVHGVHWTGVRLSDLLDEAGVHKSARALRFTSFDGVYTESLTLGQARRPDVIVAYQMDQKPVSREHGGPVRLYVAPMYGYKSIKWLNGIQVVDRVEPGYWEGFGYDVDGWVGKSNGRNDDPTS
ncbi:MAG TPA: molybdopterin-dependent oxidoreductase [Acidimicrobiia bacterium]|jgi:DMSO/TMAO reductase YedYZ molybdopterin-dependent catalytic subunit